MTKNVLASTLILVLASLGSVTTADAVVLNVGQSATINFVSTTPNPPYDFVDFSLTFSSTNPFGPSEALSYSTFDSNNVLLTSASFPSGNSVFTSGLGGQLTQNAIMPFNPGTMLTTGSFSLIVTAVSGSFELTGATANFEHVIFSSGPSQLGVTGTFVVGVPEPATWAFMLLGFAGLGFVTRKRLQRPKLA